jgi:hypothetical protein
MTVEAAKAFLKVNPGYMKWGSARLSEKLGLSTSLIRDIIAVLKVEAASSNESHSTNTGGLPPSGARRNPYEDFLAERDINPDDVVTVKHWQNMKGEPRFSVVTAEGKALGEEDILESLKASLADYVTPAFIPPPLASGDRCVVFNMFDAHIDKISLASEAYDGTDQDIVQAFGSLTERFDEVLAGVAAHNPDTIYFPVGSDFWTTNGSMNTTAKGTPQRVLAPHEEVFSRGVSFYRGCIDKMLQIAQNVVVITMKGNHDPMPVFYLGVALEVAYENESRVVVESTRRQRKYFRFGIWGFGFGHGDNEKRNMDRMPLWFAQEGKEVWYYTDMHEFFLGDIHHKEEYRFKRAHDGVGMLAYFLRSTTGTDDWHADSGWVGIPKEISAFVYNRLSGRKNVVSVSW